MATKKKSPNAAPSAPANGLMAALQGVMDDMGLKDGKTYRPVPTGINVLDFYNARYFTNHETQEQELFTGLPIGKMIGIIGYTGTGKTTLTVQAAMSLVAPYEQGTVFHFDLENAWSNERTADISGMSLDVVKQKYRRFEPVSLEVIYGFVKKVHAAKLKAMKDDPSVWVDDVRTGERIPVPTVIIIDTVAALQSQQVMENEEMGSLMFEAGAQAKANNTFAQRLAGMIGEPNITVMWVNHIRDKVDTGPVKKAKRVQYLGADETVPGGHGFPQYADYYLKMVPCDSHNDSEGFGINGKSVRCTIIKSRLSYDGRQFQLVLTDDGFNDAWCSLNFLKLQKLVKGAGAHLFIEAPDGRQTRKFAQKQFTSFYGVDDEFTDIVNSLLEQELLKLVPQPGTAAEAELLAAVEDEAGVDEALT